MLTNHDYANVEQEVIWILTLSQSTITFSEEEALKETRMQKEFFNLLCEESLDISR